MCTTVCVPLLEFSSIKPSFSSVRVCLCVYILKKKKKLREVFILGSYRHTYPTYQVKDFIYLYILFFWKKIDCKLMSNLQVVSLFKRFCARK